MSTYLIKNEITITRQEGDNASIIFIVPATLSLTGRTASFKVVDERRRTVMAKTSPTGGITITGQQITIPLLPANTKGYSGTHRWELELTTPEIITIGKGTFQIIAETIK